MLAEKMPQTSSAGRLSRNARISILCAAAAAIALAAVLAPPTAQPDDYHAFADRRVLLGIPNLLDVASNLAFLVVGVMGLAFVIRGKQADGRPAFSDPSERWGWGVAFASAALTCCGSAFYHLAPDSPRLAWDRLPMAVGFMSIVAATIIERIDRRLGLRLLAPFALVGAASVWYWRWSAVHGTENLNPYGAVQFGAMAVVLLTIVLFPPRYTRAGDFIGAGVLYGLAKVAEHFDLAIYEATGRVVSGHTLKHLLAAAAIYGMLRMLKLRTPTSDAHR